MTIPTAIAIGVLGALAYHIYTSSTATTPPACQPDNQRIKSKTIDIWNVERNKTCTSQPQKTIHTIAPSLPSCVVLQDDWSIDSVKEEMHNEFAKKCVLKLKKDKSIDIFINSWITCHLSKLSPRSISSCLPWTSWDRNCDVRILQQADVVAKKIQEIFKREQSKGGKESAQVERVFYFDMHSGSSTDTPLFSLEAYRVTLIYLPETQIKTKNLSFLMRKTITA